MLIKAGNYCYATDLPEHLQRKKEEEPRGVSSLPEPGRKHPDIDLEDTRIPMPVRAQYPLHLGCSCWYCQAWFNARDKWVKNNYGSWDEFHAVEGYLGKAEL